MVTIAAKHIPVKLLLALMACALLLAFPLPAFAVAEQVDVTVTIGQILEVDYTGPDVIEFVIGLPELLKGSVMLENQGDLLWWSNTAPWYITVERTLWETKDGDPDLELRLQVKSGPPDNGPWTDVETYPTVWIYGNSTGTGMYEGVDWNINELTWDMQPGTYRCMVTMSIV